MRRSQIKVSPQPESLLNSRSWSSQLFATPYDARLCPFWPVWDVVHVIDSWMRPFKHYLRIFLNWVPYYKLKLAFFFFSFLLRACLYGFGYPRQPSPRDNFTKRLYENCVTEKQLTLLNYAYILRRNKHHRLPLFLCSSSFIKYSCVFTFRKWTNAS